jgi:hypothetical protein
MLFLDRVVIGWQGRGSDGGGIDGAGVRVAELGIGVVEKGREEVGVRVRASGTAAKECVEDAEVDDGMAIAGGIHMSTTVDWLCDSCLCKE